MEAFHDSSSKRTLSLLFWTALLNLSITVFSFSLHVVKFMGAGFASPTSLIFAAISLLHFLSSGMSVAASFTGFDVLFIRTTIGVSIFVFVVDIISFTIRSVVDVAVTDSFRILMLIAGGAWLVLTTIEILVLAILEFQTSKWRMHLLLCIKDRCYKDKKMKKLNTGEEPHGVPNKFRIRPMDLKSQVAALQGTVWDAMKRPMSNYAAKRFWALPRVVNRARRFLSFLWPIDLVLMILYLFFFTAGVVNNTLMSILSMFMIPHLFQWAWIRAVTGPVAGELPEPAVTQPDSFMLSLTRVLVLITLFTDLISAMIRTYVLFVVPIIPDAPSFIVFIGEPISMVFAVLSTSVTYAFVLIGILENWQLQKLVKGLHGHQSSKKGIAVKKAAILYQESLLESKSKWE